MNLIPWRNKRTEEREELAWPNGAFGLLRSEMDRVLDRFVPSLWSEPGSMMASGIYPTLDVSESDTEYSVRVELPGVDPKDLEVTVSGQILTLSGEKREQSENKGENYFHSERSFGAFRRSVQLPVPVKSENVVAEFKNGVLNIRLQKQQSAVAKRIAVQAADG